MRARRLSLHLAVPAALAVGLACATGGVKVMQLSGAALAPREAGCDLEFLREPPARPYDELAELEAHVTKLPPGGAREALRDEACRLGADAVVVKKSQVLNAYDHTLVDGIAIKYRGEEAAPAQAEPKPEAPPKPPPPPQPKAPAKPAPPAEPLNDGAVTL